MIDYMKDYMTLSEIVTASEVVGYDKQTQFMREHIEANKHKFNEVFYKNLVKIMDNDILMFDISLKSLVRSFAFSKSYYENVIKKVREIGADKVEEELKSKYTNLSLCVALNVVTDSFNVTGNIKPYVMYWDKFSGNLNYPVAGDVDTKPKNLYHSVENYYTGVYGENRIDLFHHIVNSGEIAV